MSHNLSCEQCRSLLPWYVNESLSADECTAIDRHVITCAQCRKDLAEWREMAAAAQYARRVRQPPALSQMILWEALQAHIAEGHAPDERRDRALTLANDVEELLPTTAPPPRQINRRKVPAVAAVILALAVVVAFVAIFRTLGHRVAATSSTIILSVYAGEDNLGNPLGYLLALRQSDGTQLWRSAILTNPSVPVAGEGVVVVTSTSTTQPTSSPTLNLLAFDTLTGRQRWQYQTTSVASQPLLMNGIVYLSSAVDTHGMLTALTAASGTVKWQIPLSGLASTLMQVNGIIYASLINPCVGESCPSAASNVVAIRAADGRMLWELPPTGLVAPPLFAGSRLILFDSTGVLAGFDAMTGHQIWHTLIAGAGACNTACNLVVAGGIVILSATAQDGLSAIPPSLIAVRADTGDQIWQVTSQSTISTVLTDDDALIYGSHDDNADITHLITSSDGSQRWQSPANVQSQPLAATHGVIYTAEAPRSGQDSWAMVARAGANGHSLWHTALADQPTQAIANGGLLLVSAQPMISGTASQVIAGMNATNGTLLWQVAIPTGFTVFILAK